MELPIYRLIINPEDETGVEFVSLVTNPAIERDFQYFNDQKFESYQDYPKAASQNAQRGIKLNEAVNNDARQLANGEPISMETIKRTYSYLSRGKEYYNPKDTKACGTISYLLWGGDEMLRWTERKLEELELRKARRKSGFSIQDEEKRIISGAAMIADKPIYRYDEARGEYYVVFDRDTIFEIAKKWAKGDKYDSVNIHHDAPTQGLSLLESFIVDRERGIMPPKGYEEVADGSWFLSYIVNDDSIWQRVKDGEFKGFSVEGYFDMAEPEDKLLSELKSIVAKWNGKN